ncbi:uncharacterized protein LOC144440842 [Glandiceps talaboti]
MSTGSRPMFMHWKVPTRLIKPDPEHHQQQQSLIQDSNQKFYEDINGKRESLNIENDVLTQTGELFNSPDKVKGHLKSSKNSVTSTTHYSPPYHMFTPSRGKDYAPMSAASIVGSVRGSANGNGKTLPSISDSSIGRRKLERKRSETDLLKTTMQRSLKPRAQPAAEKWMQAAPDADKKVVDTVLKAADRDYVDKTLNRTLQPDAKRAVQKWMQGATDRDRDVAIQFFSSLAGSRLMGVKDSVNHDDDSNCKICDGDRLQQVLETLNKGRTGSYVLARRRDPGAIDPAKRRTHLRLLTPNTRATVPEKQTWHHLPILRHPGPVSNTIAMFTRPHRAIPRHFTIHPEWE